MSAPETPGQAAREADAEWEQAEWLHWAQANSVDPDCDRGTWTAEWMARAFKGGIQAERDPQQALPMAVAALRTIAWGSTPDGKPIDPSVVADRALAELKRLGYDEERLADAAHGQPAPAPGEAYLGLLADGWDAAARRTPGGDFAAALGTCASELRAALAAIAAQEPQPARGAPALREAVIAEVREAASCGSEEGDECPKCARHATAILAAFAAQEPKAAPAYGKRDPLSCPCCVFGDDDCWCRADCGVERCQAREVDDAEPQPEPPLHQLSGLIAGWRKAVRELENSPSAVDARQRDTLTVVIGQVLPVVEDAAFLADAASLDEVKPVSASQVRRFAAQQPAAADVRPREGQPGWHDVTCGICGAEFGTNFRLEEITCGECEARRCPHCGTWFGAETEDDL